MASIDFDVTRVSSTPQPRAEESPRRQETPPPPEPDNREIQPPWEDPALGNFVDVYA